MHQFHAGISQSAISTKCININHYSTFLYFFQGIRFSLDETHTKNIVHRVIKHKTRQNNRK